MDNSLLSVDTWWQEFWREVKLRWLPKLKVCVESKMVTWLNVYEDFKG